MKRVIVGLIFFCSIHFADAQNLAYTIVESKPDLTKTNDYYINSNTKVESLNTTSKINDKLLSNFKSYRRASQAIKFDIFGPFRGYSQITYEKQIGLNKGYELTLGIIGLGVNQKFGYPDTVITSGQNRKSQSGLFFGIGYKFYKIHVLQTHTLLPTHKMQGAYVRPTLYIGQYNESRIAFKGNGTYSVERPNTTFISIQTEFGKEWVFLKKYLIEGYWGLGYCVDNKRYYSSSYFEQNTVSAFNYCNDRVGRSPGISLTVGIKTGLLLRSKL